MPNITEKSILKLFIEELREALDETNDPEKLARNWEFVESIVFNAISEAGVEDEDERDHWSDVLEGHWQIWLRDGFPLRMQWLGEGRYESMLDKRIPKRVVKLEEFCKVKGITPAAYCKEHDHPFKLPLEGLPPRSWCPLCNAVVPRPPPEPIAGRSICELCGRPCIASVLDVMVIDGERKKVGPCCQKPQGTKTIRRE